jgi:proline iminopeptidase
MCATLQPHPPAATEGTIPVANARLYYRQIGQGPSLLILHGGPDFDHTYLLPELDRLSHTCRLIYYDQRGRGKSADHVQPAEVTLQSEIEDIEALRTYLSLDAVALLGHSWGGLLAMVYTLRHPHRVSHLILMNTAFASRQDYLRFRQERRQRAAGDLEALQAVAASAGYREGNPQTVAEYYRLHFRATLRQPHHLESMIARLYASFTREGILKARAIEERLVNETWESTTYNLLPALEALRIPTLVIHGEDDFIPVACAAHIAQAIPGARFVLLPDCGHFSYLECPAEVGKAITDFFRQ